MKDTKLQGYWPAQNWRFLSMAIVVVALGYSARAGAQTSDVRAVYDASAVIETNIPGVRSFSEPPAGFNAVAASDEELATYGFPPRPDKQNAPAAYSMWAKAMAASKIRWNGELKRTGWYSQPAQRVHPSTAAAVSAIAAGPTAAETYNWSGFVNTNNLTKYNANNSFYMVFSQFNVPTVSQAVNNCDGGWDMEVSWNGIDGDRDQGALLQGGSLSGAFCSGSVQLNEYYAWVEWWPAYPILTEFAVNPGDDMYVETWATSPTQGYVFISDMTLSLHASYSLTPNGGPGLIGNTAEYIVERPCCNGSNPKPLANYVLDFWANSYAYTFAGHAKGVTPYYPGSTASSNELVSMIDDHDTFVISAPTAQGKYGILFEAEGCAVDPGCAP
jgi:Peptidase A4 family